MGLYDNSTQPVHIHFTENASPVDPRLLSFLMNELAVSEDGETLEEAISRINVAIRQLEEVRDGLEVASLDRTHLLKPWRVSLYEDKGDREFTMLFEWPDNSRTAKRLEELFQKYRARLEELNERSHDTDPAVYRSLYWKLKGELKGE